MTDAEKFLLALAGDLPREERVILCGFVGDPNTAGTHAWRPRPWYPGNEIVVSEKANGYCTIASFTKAQDNTFRRRIETFRAGLAIMVDDVGTKVEAKPTWPKPSAIIETSPGNFQYWYFMRDRVTDIDLFDGFIRAFIQGELLGADPGMSGVTRVGRLPGFVNGKPKYKGFVTQLNAFNPNVRYSIPELLSAFNLSIVGKKFMRDKQSLFTSEAEQRNFAFANIERWLRSHRMMKNDHGPDMSGWQEIHCPWRDEHTAKADTGAAIREPSPENDWYGAFRCHHGHCGERGWSDLTDWVVELMMDELEDSNTRNATLYEQSFLEN
jgi:hypothetical protein